MALQKYTKEWLEELCANSYSLAEVLKKALCPNCHATTDTYRSRNIKKLPKINV
jgi:hypothetical protein